MPVHIAWSDDAHSILLVESHGRWTWEEYHAMLDQMVTMTRGSSHRIDFINVEMPGSTMPSGNPMPHFQRAARIFPRNLYLSVAVIHNAFSRSLLNLFTRIPTVKMPASYHAVATREEAFALIAADRAEAVTVG
jgi:hypothetical protein